MVHRAARRLADFVRKRAGDGLRTVVVVTEDGAEISYLRDDLKREYDEETYSNVVDVFRLEHPFLSPDLDSKPVGERRALVHYHENACIIQLPFSESQSILISVSSDAGKDLVTFIESCRQIVEERR